MATDKPKPGTAPGNPIQADEARWRADMIEQLRRINIGVEALNRSNDRVLRQLVEIGARTEAALQYVVRTWQATQPPKPRR